MNEKNRISSNDKKQCIVLAVIIAVSIGLAVVLSNPNLYKPIISILDSKRNSAMAISATASGVATAISLIPDDYGLPVATEISKASSYVMIAVCVLIMEKLLLSVFSILAFGIMIPLACVFRIIYLIGKKNLSLVHLSYKFAVFAVAVYLIVPLSVGVTELIEKVQDVSVESAMENIESIDNDLDENSGFWAQIKGGASNAMEKLKVKMSSFIDSVAVMIVTTCLIPFGVMLFVFWMIKTLFGVEIKTLKPKPWNFEKLKRKAPKNLPTSTEQ